MALVPAEAQTAAGGAAAATTGRTELRCGWFVNPTPANAWLVDRHGEWTIAVQGGHQADGDWPDFGPGQWVQTNGHYGHGCACLRVQVDAARKRVLRIEATQPKPLSACTKDPTLPRLKG